MHVHILYIRKSDNVNRIYAGDVTHIISHQNVTKNPNQQSNAVRDHSPLPSHPCLPMQILTSNMPGTRWPLTGQEWVDSTLPDPKRTLDGKRNPIVAPKRC